MKTTSLLKTIKLKKNIFNSLLCIIIGLFVIITILLNVTTNKKLNECRIELDYLHKTNFMDSVLSKVLFNMEGSKINNIKLHNIDGKILFDSLLKKHDYYIVAYQNGFVCDPCLEFLIFNWNIIKKKMKKNISEKILFIGENFDRSTLIFFKKVHLEKFYFIDIDKGIQSILKNNFPTNFLFFINKNRQIIYSSYFTVDTKEKFINFCEKVNKYINNNY